MRKSPYPPSFNRIAARIMDPARGASTCALGSHKWRENIGSFTRKAMDSIKVLRFLLRIIGVVW